DLNVPQFGGGVVCAGEQPPAGDDAAADASAQRQQHHVLRPLVGAEIEFAEHRGLGVVVNGRGNAKLFLDPGGEWEVPKRRQISGGDDDSLFVVDQSRTTRAGQAPSVLIRTRRTPPAKSSTRAFSD